jgi:hypothetical protein
LSGYIGTLRFIPYGTGDLEDRPKRKKGVEVYTNKFLIDVTTKRKTAYDRKCAVCDENIPKGTHCYGGYYHRICLKCYPIFSSKVALELRQIAAAVEAVNFKAIQVNKETYI